MTAIIALGLLWSVQAAAGELPAEARMKILLRVLTYDRQLESKADGQSLVLGIAYDPADPGSQKESQEVSGALEALSKLTVKGLKLGIAPVPYTGSASIASAAQGRRFGALYICASLARALPAILEETRRTKTATLGGAEALAQAGLSVVAVESGGKGQILINLKSAEAEGLKLDAGLLRIAHVTR